jgi:hypothetical protein
MVSNANGGSTSKSLDPIGGVGKLTKSKINLINRNKTACKRHLLALNKSIAINNKTKIKPYMILKMSYMR